MQLEQPILGRSQAPKSNQKASNSNNEPASRGSPKLQTNEDTYGSGRAAEGLSCRQTRGGVRLLDRSGNDVGAASFSRRLARIAFGVLVLLVCATIKLEQYNNGNKRTPAARYLLARADKAPVKLSRCSIQRDAQMDTCAAKMSFLGDHSFRIPKDLKAMGPFCNDLKESIPCIQSYLKECVSTSLPRQIVGGVLKRSRNQASLICSTESGKRNFMQKMDCLKPIDSISKFHNFMDASVARFEFIATQEVGSDDKLIALCCSYAIFQRELDITMARACGKDDNTTREFIRKVASVAVGEFYQVICEGFRTVDECRASDKTSKIIDRLEQVTTSVKENRKRPNSKSLVPVLLQILNAASKD